MEDMIKILVCLAIVFVALILIAIIMYIITKCYEIQKLKEEKYAYELIQEEEDLEIKLKKAAITKEQNNLRRQLNSTPQQSRR